MDNLRIGIIGLGAVGKRLLEQFAIHENVSVEMLCDTNPVLARETSEQYSNISWTTDYHDILKNGEIDWVYIAVPPKYHYEIVIDAIESGKHILCEKPLANSYEEAKEMYGKAQAAGIIHAMNFPTPYSAAFQVIKEKIKKKTAGEIKRIEVKGYFHEWPRPWQQNNWIASKEQGGFTREVFPHYLQIILQLFGKVTVEHANISFPADNGRSEQSMLAFLKLEDGTPVLLDGVSDIAMEEKISFTIYGTKETISLLDWRILKVGGSGEKPEDIPLESKNSLARLIDELVKAHNGKQAELVSFEQGFAVQEVLEKLLKN
ncbi:Gfo/Idh/MocA family protein [Bacillus sp. V3-13]|uniref:Gfo/Idh/MocA family protein n=1 Tax=Bacillus sp. V3-13 TaxID=2053728 RepID=UPI0015E0D2C5|nr:Gfo/Idh/MocA family oxidoreductase [Bacillus sp. V3-13]